MASQGGAKKTFLYFAFGSNLLTERIHINNPSAIFKNIAKLKEHKLDFNYFSQVIIHSFTLLYINQTNPNFLTLQTKYLSLKLINLLTLLHMLDIRLVGEATKKKVKKFHNKFELWGEGSANFGVRTSKKCFF